MDAKPVHMKIYRTAIPMRSFEHAAATRSVAEAVVTRLEFSNGAVGWGETLPRRYVTGETLDSVVADLRDVIWPACLQLDPCDAEQLDAIPVRSPDGRCINAAACAFELACFRQMEAWFDRHVRHRRISTKVSGVLGSPAPAVTAKRLRLMQWYGLRDFKLKLGFGEDVDAENLRIVHKRLGGSIAGTASSGSA